MNYEELIADLYGVRPDKQVEILRAAFAELEAENERLERKLAEALAVAKECEWLGLAAILKGGSSE